MGEVTKNDCQVEHMNDDEIHINIEFGSAGLYYGTSPQMKGLLVTGESIKEVVDRVPNAIAEMRAVAAMGPEIERLRSELKQAREIIRVLADMEPSTLVEPGSDDDRYTLYLSKPGQAHEIHGDDIRRARTFLKEHEDG